jgi:CelD/BcsL family acetyltransferase involved in cellulose biosynthesis
VALIIEIADDLAAFEALEADWRELFSLSATDNFFVSYDWCKIWWDTFGGPAGSQPVLVTVRREGRLVALLPLSVWRTGPRSSAQAMGGESGQYCDMLIAPEMASDQDIFNALWDGIVASGIDWIQFNNVPDDSALARFLAPRRTIQSEPTIGCCLDTADHENFDAYMKTRSASLRKSMRRRWRKLETLGTVTFETVTDPGRLDEISRTIVGHKRQWLADRGLHGRFLSRPNVAAWMADVMRAALKTRQLHLSLLRIDDRIISAQLGFICGGRMTGYFASFDLEYGPYSVGTMQVRSFIEKLFDRRFKIDLMPPDDDYKLEWVDRSVGARAYTVPVTRLGTMETLLLNSRNRATLKKMYLSLPDGIRASIAAAGLHATGGLRELLSRGSDGPK